MGNSVEHTGSKSLSLAFIVPNLGHMGGSIRVTCGLANKFAEVANVAIISCAPFAEPGFELDPSVRTYAMDLGEGRLRERTMIAYRPLLDIYADCKPDIVFGIGTYETLFTLRACHTAHVKLVFCDHGALINQWDDKQMRMIRRLGAIFSKRTVTLTQKNYDDYHKLLHIPKRKLLCIPNWIPQELLDAPHTYDVTSKKLLWAGRLDKEKGVDHLVEIAKYALADHPDWTWDVYGERVVMKGGFDVEPVLEEYGLTGRVRLMGRADNIFELYDKHAVCTLTSYREGLPLTLLEGKACGLPLISFDVDTGPRDIIEDGVDGFLVERYDCKAYAEKLCQLMDDDALRVSMSKASQRTVGRFSENEIFAKWDKLVAELMA